jgi:peroxiredoxin
MITGGRSVAFTVADYILKRLSEQHIDRLFGVPAAYCPPCSMRRRTTASNLSSRRAIIRTICPQSCHNQ